MPFRCHKPS